MGVSDQFLRVLTRLYSKDSFSILLEDDSTPQRFNVTAGVHEGSPLSPLLFILFMSDLVEHLRRCGSSLGGFRLRDGSTIFCILYADDVLLIATSAAALQRLIDDTSSYFTSEGMCVNPGKSDIVVFSNSRVSPPIQFTIGAEVKDPVSDARYLGVLFERNQSWKKQKEAAVLRSRVALGRSKVICSSLGLTNPNTLLQIFDMFVSSVYRYSAGAWGPVAGKLDEVDGVFCDFIKSRYRLPRTACNSGILMQFGRRCASCDAFYLASVQVARGMLSPQSTWGKVLASALSCQQNRWIKMVRGRLELMGMTQEVFEPSLFLENRKAFAVNFSQWCHHNHFRFANGTSADLMRTSRPFGAMPALLDVPTTQGRDILLMLLSAWRWGLEEAEFYPEYCMTCDCLTSSHHLLFGCRDTEDIRQAFERDTGLPFNDVTLYQERVSLPLARVFAAVCYRLKRGGRRVSQPRDNGVST
jgi:hypothetical protein